MNSKLVLPATLVAIMVLGLSQPVSAQPTQSPDYEITPSTINVEPCTEFTINIWIVNIDDIPGDYYLDYFTIIVQWHPGLMELAAGSHLSDISQSGSYHRNLWESRGYRYSGGYIDLYHLEVFIKYEPDTVGPWNNDDIWLTLTFHCLGAGTSDISVYVGSSASEVYFRLRDAGGESYQVDMARVSIPCNQQAPPRPSSSGWVGGELHSVNKLAVLAPYLALIAVATVATIYVVKRRLEN